MAGDDEAPPRARPLLRLVGASRWLMVIAVLGALAIGTVLLARTALDTAALVRHALDADSDGKLGKQLSIRAIELLDRYLIASVTFITAIGLCELFLDERVPVPPWLRVHSLSELKDRLLHVIVVVLAVLAVGQLAAWQGGIEIIAFGGAVVAVIAGIAMFTVLAGKAQA